MGGIRRQRRKFSRPQHPWKAERVASENELVRKYGLKNKKEIWKTAEKLRRIRQQARKLLGSSGEEALKEKSDLVAKLSKWGVLKTNNLEDILALTAEDLFERRLQTIVFKKALAKTPNQARQLVTHKHVKVGSRFVSVPGYIVLKSEEDGITLSDKIKVNDFDAGKENKEAKEGN
jgi:small subunit ribosomal protein S4